LPVAELSDLAGGTAADNARMIVNLLAGEAGPRRDIVVLNAGAALLVAGAASSMADGVRMAQEAIDDGRARRTLDKLREACGK